MLASKLDSFYRRQAPLYDITRQLILFNYNEAVDMLNLCPDDIVYDMACGTGKVIPYLLKKLQADCIYGFDYSHILLQQARKKFPNIGFYHTDITKPFSCPTPTPSKIICSYGISMIDRRENALDIMRDMLEEQGTLIILDFNPTRKPTRRGKIFQKHLTLCQINLQQDVTTYLQKKTKNIQILILNKGYNMIIKATK